MNKTFFENDPVSTVQRLGFLLEQVPEQTKLTPKQLTKEKGCTFQKIPLKNGNQTKECDVDLNGK